MLPFFLKDFDNSAELPKLVQRLGPYGDSIYAYRQVYSLILFTFRRTIFEVVPNGRSPALVGLKHAIVSLIFGPWSWFGPFATLHALLTDLSGGSNVTDLVDPRTGLSSVPLETLREDAERKEKLVQVAFVTILFAVLGILIWKVVIPVYDPTAW